MQARLAFALSMAIDFDTYLIDEVMAVGDSRFQARCVQAFAERRQRSGMIVVSHSEGTIKEYCSHCMVLVNANIIVFEDVDEGIGFYRANF